MSTLHEPAVHRWTVDEFEQLGRAGFFQQEKRVELLHGEIIERSPIGYRHARVVSLLSEFFIQRASGRYFLQSQNPFDLDRYSQPEPDLALLDPVCRRVERHPRAEEIFLVIEVADTSFRYDRNRKGPAYASQSIREFWLFNLVKNRLEVYRRKQGGIYRDRTIVGLDESAAPLAFPDLELRPADFLA